MSETDIQREILAQLALMPGVFVWRQNSGAMKVGRRYIKFGLTGQADISGLLQGGRRLEIEVKTKAGVLSLEQVAFGARINALGGLWFVARSVDEAIAKVKEALV